MSKILIPEGVSLEENEQEVEATEAPEVPAGSSEYKATEEDEERFFLMYHMNFQPSEVEKLSPNYRKWLIMRFMGQKHMEQEAMQRQQLMQQIGPNLKVQR